MFTVLYFIRLVKTQWSADWLRPGWATRHYNINLGVSVGKRKDLPHSGCLLLCSNDSSLPLFLSEKNIHTHSSWEPACKEGHWKRTMLIFPPVTVEVQEIIKVAVFCVGSLSWVFGVSRDSTAIIKDTIKHLYCMKRPVPKTAVWACRNGYICTIQCHTKFEYIKQP